MAKKKILIVDDEVDLVKLLKTELEDKGYDVVIAMNGEEGVRATLLEKPDLLILDIMMPVMDGYEALSRLRNNERTKRLPVIILSAKGETYSILDLQKLGATDYLIKPFESEELLETIQKYLGGGQGFLARKIGGSEPV